MTVKNAANLPSSGPLSTYSAIPIISRQRLANIQVEAVSILIARQRLTLSRNKITQREYPLQGGSVLTTESASSGFISCWVRWTDAGLSDDGVKISLTIATRQAAN